jgi:hypothetical protein
LHRPVAVLTAHRMQEDTAPHTAGQEVVVLASGEVERSFFDRCGMVETAGLPPAEPEAGAGRAVAGRWLMVLVIAGLVVALVALDVVARGRQEPPVRAAAAPAPVFHAVIEPQPAPAAQPRTPRPALSGDRDTGASAQPGPAPAKGGKVRHKRRAHPRRGRRNAVR